MFHLGTVKINSFIIGFISLLTVSNLMIMTQLNLGWDEKKLILQTNVHVNVLFILTDRFTYIIDYEYYCSLTDRWGFGVAKKILKIVVTENSGFALRCGVGYKATTTTTILLAILAHRAVFCHYYFQLFLQLRKIRQ